MAYLFIRCAIPFDVARTNKWKKTIRALVELSEYVCGTPRWDIIA